MNERSRPRAPRIAVVMFFAIIVILYLPLLGMMFGSVWTLNPDGSREWTLRWFVEVFQDQGLVNGLVNSLLIAVISSLISTVIGTAGAIGLARGNFLGKKLLQSLAAVSLVFPEIVFALSLLSWFVLMQLGLGLVTVILAHVSFSLAYVLMTVGARLANFDPSLEDAARDLGASEIKIMTSVVLPILKPAVVSSFILSFLLSFDDFLITFFVNGVGRDTLPIKLYTAMRIGTSPKLNALSTILFVASSFILRRYLVQQARDSASKSKNAQS